MESMTGHLLVATPTLKDPNFDRTVVLLVAHETGGALGVVLNRATEVPVADVLGNWGELAGDPAVLFEGGPVQPESAICLARTRPQIKKRVSGFHQASATTWPCATASGRTSPGSPGPTPATWGSGSCAGWRPARPASATPPVPTAL